MKQRFKKIVGILFIGLGLIALFTPLTPGSWLIFVGLELMGLRLLFQKKFLEYRKLVKTFLHSLWGKDAHQ